MNLHFNKPWMMGRDLGTERIDRILKSNDRASATAMGIWDQIKDLFCGQVKKFAMDHLFDLVQVEQNYKNEQNPDKKIIIYANACYHYRALQRFISSDQHRCIFSVADPAKRCNLIIRRPDTNEILHEFIFSDDLPGLGNDDQIYGYPKIGGDNVRSKAPGANATSQSGSLKAHESSLVSVDLDSFEGLGLQRLEDIETQSEFGD